MRFGGSLSALRTFAREVMPEFAERALRPRAGSASGECAHQPFSWQSPRRA